MDAVQNILTPHGIQAQHIARLWNLTLVITACVFAAVLVAMLTALRKGSRRRSVRIDEVAETTLFRSVVWSVLLSAALLFALIAADFFTARALAILPGAKALQIELTGHQWWWEARYSHDQPSLAFTTANELHIPIGRPVAITLKSADVIHSFWIPALHGKKDLIPGQTALIRLRADKAGTYRGQCAEFCGLQHARMAITVVAEPSEQFEAWVDVQRQPASSPTTASQARGLAVFLRATCASCHAIQGTTANAIMGPDLTHIASRPTLAAGTIPNDAAHLRRWIADPQQIKPGVNMPAHPMPPDDLQALVDYLGQLK
jgi:cytochrome c oxidase subunit II